MCQRKKILWVRNKLSSKIAHSLSIILVLAFPQLYQLNTDNNNLRNNEWFFSSRDKNTLYLFIKNTNDYGLILSKSSLTCSGTGTVISSVDVPNASNADGLPDDTYASLYQSNDEIVIDLGVVLSENTTITIAYEKQSSSSSNATLIVNNSAGSSSGFVAVAESTITTSSPNNVPSTFTITATAGNQYLQIISDNGIDVGIDGISFTCPSSSGGSTTGNINCSAGNTEITGTVFEDYNYDGLYDAEEYLGIKGMPVSATDSLGNIFNAVTDVDGNYTLSGLTASRTYRIEFTFPDSIAWASPTFYNGDNGTTVQFVQPGSCANLGISAPSNYCEEDPTIGVSCFGEGAYNGANAADPAFIALPYSADGHDFSGTTKTVGFEGTTLATQNDIGATYGLAWQPTTERLYLAAFHKRYSGFGPSGPDAIYQFSLDGTLTGTLELDVLLGNSNTTGSDVHDLVTTNNGEVMDLGTGNASFDGVGKRSFGDIEFSGNLDTLYVVNLFDRKIYPIHIVDGIVGNATVGTAWDAPDATGAGRHRPFGLKWQEGKLWIGSVDENGSNAYIHSLNVSTGSTNLELTIPLNFDRQNVIGGSANHSDPLRHATWKAWAADPEIINYGINGSEEINYCQPILSDIEFDGKDMILGFRDRFADQSGVEAFFSNTDASNNTYTFGMSGGDILRVCFDDSAYILETGNSGSCPGISGRDMSGPGGEEFYHWDIYEDENTWNPLNTSEALHWETAQGALLQLQGKPSVMTTAMDPFDDYSSGLLKLDNNTGRREGLTGTDNVAVGSLVGGYTIFDSGDWSSGPPSGNGTFAKANGLGDIEAFCSPAPIEIGNYVWYDEDEDGVQDAGETPLEGVRMELFDNAGNLLAFDTTNSLGYYFFSGNGIDDANWQTADDTIQSNTSYYIVAGGGGQFANDTLSLNGQYYGLTSDSTATGVNQYAIDSDGTIASGIDPDFDGKPYSQITTVGIGEVNHTLDFGFIPPPTCTNPTVSAFAIQPSCTDGSPNSDGYLQISQITDGDRYHFSTGNTFDDNGGANTYVNATTFTTFPEQTTHNLANPATTQDYTIRVYNGADDCFTDLVVTLERQDCTIGCDCTEMIYLNEPTTSGAVHKFSVAMDTLTEIGSPWFDNAVAMEGLSRPHGLGTDLNGYLYIGEREIDGHQIRKFTCDGEIFPESDFAINSTGQFNMASIGNYLYHNNGFSETGANNGEILETDLCTQSETGKLQFCESLGSKRDWGFYIDPRTNDMYATAGFAGSTNYFWHFTQDDFDTISTTCVSAIDLGTTFPSTNADIRGLTTDIDGNLYIVVREDNNITNSPTYLLKYGPAPSFNYISTSSYDIAEDGTGYRKAAGIVYSETSNLLYVSTESAIDDCVSVFDTNLNYLRTGVPSPGTGDNAKGIAIIKECCPTNNNITIDTTLCTASLNDIVFLQELINCDGIICEGTWQEGMSNTGMSFNSCDNSITINGLNACGIFTLESDGTGNNPQCGAFKITVNISVNIVTASIIAGDQTICSGDTPSIFTVNSSATSTNGDTLMYQWQSSIDSLVGYSDIIGADGATYAPPNTLSSDTTYFQVIVRSTSAGCASGLCADTSNILAIIVQDCDWGDLPDPNIANNVANYQTLRDSSGPVHVIIPGLHLGSSVDGESNGQPTDNALGDGNDEDGLRIFESLDMSPGGIIRLPLHYTNTTGQTAHIEAWIDWNGDGAFDGVGEMVLDVSDTGDSAYDRLEVTVPNDAITEQFLGLRIRISHTDNMTPYGKINSGEIEDYLIGLDCATQICVPLQTIIIRKE